MLVPTSMVRGVVAAVVAWATCLALPSAWGWGGPHSAMTRAAVGTLPDWQKAVLGEEAARLGAEYCFIPDWIFSHKEFQSYAILASEPGTVYNLKLHLSSPQPVNHEVLRGCLTKVVSNLKAGRVDEAAKFAGTLVHAIEDWGCPAHAVPGDNQFTLMKQFLPPPPGKQYALLHSQIESGNLTVDLGGYSPRLLGTSVDEAAFRLLHRVNGMMVAARAHVIPIIQGLYGGDRERVVRAQTAAATSAGEVVADALYSALCLGQGRFPPDADAVLSTMDLSGLVPLEATNLALPQSSFFSKPYWGRPHEGVILRGGGEPVPLILRVAPDGKDVEERRFDRGIGLGTRSVLTYLVPDGVFREFSAVVGLHAELGRNGNVAFEVNGDGKLLCRVGPMAGEGPAQAVCVSLAGVSRLQLVTKSAGGDGSGNYAVWGEPRLVK